MFGFLCCDLCTTRFYNFWLLILRVGFDWRACLSSTGDYRLCVYLNSNVAVRSHRFFSAARWSRWLNMSCLIRSDDSFYRTSKLLLCCVFSFLFNLYSSMPLMVNKLLNEPIEHIDFELVTFILMLFLLFSLHFLIFCLTSWLRAVVSWSARGLLCWTTIQRSDRPSLGVLLLVCILVVENVLCEAVCVFGAEKSRADRVVWCSTLSALWCV